MGHALGGGRLSTVRTRLAGSGRALWVAFGAVHAWLTLVGVVLIPSRAFYDVDLYRYWVALGRSGGGWPVFDGDWVYPVGALVPMLLPAGVSVTSPTAYALGWCALVTALDAIAVVALIRRGRGPEPEPESEAAAARRTGAWWWLAFLVLLGPVAMGRIDAILAPIVVVALLEAVRRPRLAAALITVGAWIKVAPGVLISPLLVIARRPLRDVVAPAALVTAAVVGVVTAGGGLRHLASFLFTQDTRGLQVEAVAATPWTLAALVRDDVVIGLNRELITWEITGPGTVATARALDVLLPLAVVGLAALLWRARSRPADVLLWGSLALATLLIVVNKVGSPQYIGWLAPPIAVALASRRGARELAVAPAALRRLAIAVLAIAAATQVIFPLAYQALLDSDPLLTGLLAARNAALVAVLVATCSMLARSVRRARA